ncbi:MAG: hypothetical protein A2Z21_01995 [Candidatus Fraserbacteria bacterium RBG_16_55_9]|uniref:HTH cro/C1-type domain-containing protein n=1 Tax=Fraserbacteria sp. (strain RBG_16_55_9) TaxID=1817864 RepID=A0A1F5UP70_FRAXR|nr:MAG: hypothetical protein A2Z21_01995 [Candidatus Fraserbacteria bacterium RBG_16_55_9]
MEKEWQKFEEQICALAWKAAEDIKDRTFKEISAICGVQVEAPARKVRPGSVTELGKRMRKVREIYGLTQVNLADRFTRAGFRIARGTLANIENGRFNPSVEYQMKAAEVLVAVKDDAAAAGV